MRIIVGFISQPLIISGWRIDRCPARAHRGQCGDVNESGQWLKKMGEVEVKFRESVVK
jgi:hypothetical protein